jgi:hypothetical protein
MLGWAGIREEWASVLISYTPTMIPCISCIVKPRKGKSLSNITYFFLTHALKKHCEQLLPERTSLYMRDLENGGVGWATTSLSRFFCMHAQILFMRWRSCTSIPIEA